MGRLREEGEMKGMMRRKSGAGHGAVWAGCAESPSKRFWGALASSLSEGECSVCWDRRALAWGQREQKEWV